MVFSRNRVPYADEKLALADKLYSEWTGLSRQAFGVEKSSLEEAAHGFVDASKSLSEQMRKVGEDAEAGISVADEQKRIVDKDVEKDSFEILRALSQDCEVDTRITLLCDEVNKNREKLRAYQDWTGVKFMTSKNGDPVVTTVSKKNGFAVYGGDIRTGSRFVIARNIWKWLEEQHLSDEETNDSGKEN